LDAAHAGIPHFVAESRDGGHGRKELRRVTTLDALVQLPEDILFQWSNCETIARVQSEVERDGRTAREERFCISTLTRDRSSRQETFVRNRFLPSNHEHVARGVVYHSSYGTSEKKAPHPGVTHLAHNQQRIRINQGHQSLSGASPFHFRRGVGNTVGPLFEMPQRTVFKGLQTGRVGDGNPLFGGYGCRGQENMHNHQGYSQPLGPGSSMVQGRPGWVREIHTDDDAVVHGRRARHNPSRADMKGPEPATAGGQHVHAAGTADALRIGLAFRRFVEALDHGSQHVQEGRLLAIAQRTHDAGPGDRLEFPMGLLRLPALVRQG